MICGLMNASGCGAVRRDVGDQHALVHIDLRRGEADALGRVHRLEHVVDESRDSGVDGARPAPLWYAVEGLDTPVW